MGIGNLLLSKDVNWIPVLYYLMRPINFEFVMGMCIAYLARKVPNRHGMMIFLFGMVILVVLLQFVSDVDKYRYFFGVPFSAFVLGGVLMERQKILWCPQLMVIVGNASYSIYLVHEPLLSLAGRLFGSMHKIQTWWLSMLVSVVFCITVGVLYHYIIEKPLIRLFRKYLKKWGFIREEGT